MPAFHVKITIRITIFEFRTFYKEDTMTRYRFRFQIFKTTGVAALWLYLSAMIVSCVSSPSEMPERKPNIIYILADDLGYGDVGCYGQKRFKTPNIDRLAAEGKRFTDFYAGSTVCAPSRSVLMTGLHTGHTPVRGNRTMAEQAQYPLPSMATLPVLLKQAGYVTGAFGKWGLGHVNSEGGPGNQGIDEFFGYNSQGLAHNYYIPELWHNDQKVPLPENEGLKRGTYAPNLIHEKTLEFIERNKDTTFFLYVPSIIPHAELFAPEEYMARFTERSSPESTMGIKSLFEPEKPYQGVDAADHPRFKKGGYGSQSHPRAAFAAMVTLLDDQVGEIMKKVKELGIEENTIIVFTSDNGPHVEGGADPEFFNSNGPFKGYKRDLYEGGIRVPLIIKWDDKVAPGSTSDHVFAAWDMLPTFCHVAGIDAPETDGISFYPELVGEEEQPQHEFLYWEFHEQGKKQAVRYGHWKGVRKGLEKNPNAPLELYNLSEDIGEEKDLAGQHPEIEKTLLECMNASHDEDPEWPFLNATP